MARPPASGPPTLPPPDPAEVLGEARPPSRSRFERRPAAGIALGDRDRELLTDVYLHRAMSRRQIGALHFESVARCNARLRQLFDHRLLARFYPPLAPWGAQAVYSLGPAGVGPVALCLEERGLAGEAEAVRRQARQDRGLPERPLSLEHTLAVGDFGLSLRGAVAGQDAWALERWLPELPCRHEYEIRDASSARPAWRAEVFKPDGFVRLVPSPESVGTTPAAESRPAEFNGFLEMDMGHVSAPRFALKLRGYRRYRECGLFAEVYGGGDFRVLTVTTGPKRLGNLAALAEAEGFESLLLTTFAELERDGPLAPIWRDAGRGDRPYRLWGVGMSRGGSG